MGCMVMWIVPSIRLSRDDSKTNSLHLLKEVVVDAVKHVVRKHAPKMATTNLISRGRSYREFVRASADEYERAISGELNKDPGIERKLCSLQTCAEEFIEVIEELHEELAK